MCLLYDCESWSVERGFEFGALGSGTKQNVQHNFERINCI
jgi:hypothetical protein